MNEWLASREVVLGIRGGSDRDVVKRTQRNAVEVYSRQTRKFYLLT